MLKKYILVSVCFVIFLVSLTFTKPVLALKSCEDATIQIQSEPKFFPVDGATKQLKLFTTNNEVKQFLTNKKARLAIIKGRILNVKDDYDLTEVVTIEGNGVAIFTLPDGAFIQPGTRNVNLDIANDKGEFPNDSAFCKDIVYKIGGSVEKCYFDPSLPKNVPPGTKLPIKFVGNAESNYNLSKKVGNNHVPIISSKTDKDGRGVFQDISVGDKSGENSTFQIRKQMLSDIECELSILVAVTAPTPPRIDGNVPIPVDLDPAGSGNPKIVFAGATTLGAGQLCKNDTGVDTALGCIPNDPGVLIKSLVEFLVSIGGAIALLIMAFSAIQMMAQGSDAKALQAAQQRFVTAAIGLTFLIFSVFILRVIGVDILQIPGFK